ncbi:phage tail tip protein J-related protein [Vibrio nomapromontoriensis]|uniref:phage tail tip protein J-related protein n=1 Tax=Vibrio nomapromontoriensis TaxID=2910246 RepID=UPI003D101DB8
MGVEIAVAGWIIAAASAGYAVYTAIDAKRQAEAAANAAKGKRTAQKQMYKSATAPKQIILGHPVTSGPMVFGAEEGTPNDEGVGEWLHLVVHLAGHPCDDVTDAWLDDIVLTRHGGSGNYDIEYRHPNGEGFVYLYLGNHTTAPSTLLSLPDWDASMIGAGDCFAHVKLRSNPDKWAGGVPNPKFAVKGLAVLDPRTGQTTWTDNPALLYRWYRNVLKHGVADEATYIASANLCNEAISTPEGVEKRYRCNYAFLANENPRTVMSTLRSTCAGLGLRVAGRHGLQVGAYYGPGTVVLDDNDIISDITTQADVRRRDRINTVTAKYTDPKSNWNELDMPRIQSSTFVAEDNGFEVIDDLDLAAVPSPFQAQRLSWIHLNTKRSALNIEFTCNLKAVQLLPGTVFRLNLKDNQWNGVEFIVTKWISSNENGIKLRASQHFSSQYAWDGSQAVAPIRPGLPSQIDRTLVEPVSHLTYATSVESHTLQAIISWQHRSFGRTTFELSFYQNGSFLYRDETTDKQYRLRDGFTVGTYEVRVLARNAGGASSTVASLAFIARAPQTPQSIDVDAGNWTLFLSPVSSGLVTFDTFYDIALGFDVGTSDSELASFIMGRAKVLTVSNLKANTEYHIAAREVSRWGESGWVRTTATTTFSSDDILEVIKDRVSVDMLDSALKESIAQNEKRAIDLGNLLADKSRLNDDLKAAYQAFKDKEQTAKTDVGFVYAERKIQTHNDQLSTQAEEIAQLVVADKDNLAAALSYTRSAVGYCVDKNGNITDHNNAVLCVQAGHSWIDGPLAEFIRNLQVQTASGSKASIGNMMQVFEKEGDTLVARGSMLSNVDGQITGFVSNNDGTSTQLDFIAQHTRMGVLDEQGQFVPLFYLNSQTNTLTLKAQLILTDGHTVESLDDIKAQDGAPGKDGADGINGKDGVSGNDGAPGRDGVDGTQGNDGAPGRDGVDGAKGNDGAPGQDGADGAKGDDGAPGKDGINGTDGKDGAPGQPGSRWYTLTLRNGVFPISSTATGDFTQHFGRAPIQDDLLTYRNSAGTTVSTKSFDGALWVTPNLLFSGSLIAKGTLYGDRFVAGSEIASPVIKGGHGYYGAGGSFNGYHTHIDNDGTIYTSKLNLKSAASGGRQEITSDRTSIYDDTNSLVFRFGRLTE